MYGRKGSELVKELATSEPGQLCKFNNDLFATVLEECNGHLLHLQPLMRKIQDHENKLKDRRSGDEVDTTEDESRTSEAEKMAIQNDLKSDQFGALVHHLSLLRNKRCLMGYIYKRAEVIRNLGWMVNGVLPEEIEQKLSQTEREYFNNHSQTFQSYIEKLDIELAVDMVPPKDPYIKVRVLDNIGDAAIGNQIVHLAPQVIMFLRRTDAEPYITQGKMEELTAS